MKSYYSLLILFFISFNTYSQTTTTVVHNLSSPASFVFLDSILYISSSHTNKIYKEDLRATSIFPASIVSGLNNPRGLALDGNYLYIAEFDSNKITKIDITLTAPIPEDVITGLNGPFGIAVYGSGLYISERNANKISRIDLNSSTPTLEDVITGLNKPLGIKVNGNDLYISEFDGNKVSKVDLNSISPTLIDVLSITNPNGLEIKDDFLYISHDNKVSKYNLLGTSTTASDYVPNLNEPTHIMFINDELYIAEFFGVKISKFNESIFLTVDSYLNKEVKLYPNPVSNMMTINSQHIINEYKVYSIEGVLVKDGKLNNSISKLNMSELPSGVYLIQVSNSRGSFSKKFIKE